MRRVLIWRTGCAVLLKTSVEELRIRAFLIVYSEHLTQALIISVGLSQHAKRICEPVSRIAVSQHKIGPSPSFTASGSSARHCSPSTKDLSTPPGDAGTRRLNGTEKKRLLRLSIPAMK